MSVLCPVITVVESEKTNPCWAVKDVALNAAHWTVTHAFLHGQLSFSTSVSRAITLLDTLDQFDYDSACTMILNLESFMSVAGVDGF